ncbi:MAG: RIP metalloprotease RseP [Deltaproteobacteria bacterium]|jgi:regulator of sigma E protease|nr:RIP metalloprotease RseP [Deltaproteobacteria bacterium]
MLTTLVSFIVLLVILIFVHELGHFLAAKILGVRVLTFSLGFPPRIFSKKIGETVYQLAWIPLGGYVKLFGEEPGEEVPEEERHRSLNHKPVWAKSVIVLAGPFFNIVFSVFALWLLTWASGIQHAGTVLGPLDPESPLARAGLMRDDLVREVDGTPVKYFDELIKAERESGGRTLAVTVERGGALRTFEVVPERKTGKGVFGDEESYWTAGFVSRGVPLLREARPSGPAGKAGLLPGDLVVSIDGEPTPDWRDVVRLIQGRPQAERQNQDGSAVPIVVEVERGGALLSFTVTPDMEPSQDLEGKTTFTPLIGISPELEILREPVGPARAFALGVSDTWRMAKLTVLSVVKLLQNKISAKLMGGPIMIAEIAGKTARDGLADFILLMCFISVNLAILNLLPLPILDGGQFVIFLIEGIKRGPISLKAREITQWVGVCCLVALMVLVFYNDISRLVTKFSGPPAAQVEERSD